MLKSSERELPPYELEDLRRDVAETYWYHTLELRPGLVTPGHFDLRPIVDRMPWPDIRGKRCLDVATADGFFAFEMERRGAAEVVAVDIPSHDNWDWPTDIREHAAENFARLAGPVKGKGFAVAHRALGSKVRKEHINVYDLADSGLGKFDFVICGSLLLHLRDPLRALESIRALCGEYFLSAEQVDLRTTITNRRHPVATLNGLGDLTQWWVPNTEGHRRMVRAAGFEIERATRPYGIPFGVGHPPLGDDLWSRLSRGLQGRLMGGYGVAHAAVLARPATSPAS